MIAGIAAPGLQVRDLWEQSNRLTVPWRHGMVAQPFSSEPGSPQSKGSPRGDRYQQEDINEQGLEDGVALLRERE